MSHASRPTLLKIGIGLLALHEVSIIGLCGLGSVLGSVAVVLGSRETEEGNATALVAVGGLVALALFVGIGFATLSLAVCAMAWKGSRRWVQALLCFALVNGIAFVPNPIGILAAVFCVLGGLEHLDNERRRGMIGEPEIAGRVTGNVAGSVCGSAEE